MRLKVWQHFGGFSLVEFIVSTLIILSTILVILEVQVKTSAAREAIQGGQAAQYNGATAIDYMALAAKQSGFGISVPALYGSVIHYYDPIDAAEKTETWSPVTIGGSTPNAFIRFMWSNSEHSTPITLSNTYTPSTNPSAMVSSSFGILDGELILFSGPSAAFVKQVSASSSGSLALNSTSAAPFNGSIPSIAGATLPIGSQVFRLGGWERQTFYIQNNALWVRRQTSLVDTEALLADNVIGLSAQYGLDNGANGGTLGDGQVDVWADSLTGVQWPQLTAIRVGLLTRSPKKDRKIVSASNSFVWSGGTFTVSSPSDWNLFRYRVFEYTLPLRNTLWPIKTS